jgi:hypothetical protein
MRLIGKDYFLVDYLCLFPFYIIGILELILF